MRVAESAMPCIANPFSTAGQQAANMKNPAFGMESFRQTGEIIPSNRMQRRDGWPAFTANEYRPHSSAHPERIFQEIMRILVYPRDHHQG